jgi:hypothetical protein
MQKRPRSKPEQTLNKEWETKDGASFFLLPAFHLSFFSNKKMRKALK